MSLSITSVLTPFSELQRDKEKTMDDRSYELRCQRIVDRALIESGMRMREVLKQADPLSSPDLQELVDAEAKLQKIAAEWKISEQLVTAEVQNLSPAYVAEKDAVRAENQDAAKKDMVKKVTRFITNKYAACQAYAVLIREAIAARKAAMKEAAPAKPAASAQKPAAKTPDLKPAIVTPVRKEEKLPLPDDGEFTLQINEEPVDLGPDADLSSWLEEPRENDSVIGTAQPPAEEAKPKK